MTKYNYIKPNSCNHFPSILGTYQKNKFELAMNFCSKFNVAIDVGGHVGHWSHNLVSKFKTVYTFEAVKENFDCLKQNVPDAICYNIALGEAEGLLNLYSKTSKNSGTWTFDSTGNNVDETTVPMRTLDSFKLNPDFIKMDIQESEYKALLGAYMTLTTYKPVLCLESAKNKFRADIHNYLTNLGYKCVRSAGKEEYFVHALRRV